MKLRLSHFFIIVSILMGGLAFAQLQEPKSDPHFSDSDPQPEVEEADVQLKRSDAPIDTEVTDDIAPPLHHVVTKPEGEAPSSFSVTRVRMNNATRAHPKLILLLTPAHNTVYTPGVITFSWKFANPPKKKVGVILKVERLDGRTRYSKKVTREKKLLDLSPGEYKWQVGTGKSGQESRWRFFKVQDTKSHSLTELYNGPGQSKKTKKTKPIISAYIKEVEPDDEIDDSEDTEMQADDDDEPLQIPDSLKRTPAGGTQPAGASEKVKTEEPDLVAPDWVKQKKSD